MLVALGVRTLPGSDRPFELMTDCHHRIECSPAVRRRILKRYAKRESLVSGRSHALCKDHRNFQGSSLALSSSGSFRR